jgi:hypothetical protein
MHPPINNCLERIGLTIGGVLALYLNDAPIYSRYSSLCIIDASSELRRAFHGIAESEPSLLIWVDGFTLFEQLVNGIKNPKNSLLLEKLFSKVEAKEIGESEFNQAILDIAKGEYES